MKEKPIVFGEDDSLIGVYTAAVVGSGADRPAVLFLNAGVIHRVGPHRLHVLLARRLAAVGFPTLRFDLSGIGDSRPAGASHSYDERARADVRAAMDFMGRTTGARRFILIGLCSGADFGVAVALQDERVAGLVLLDPYSYATPGALARKVIKRMRHLKTPRRIAVWGARVTAARLRGLVSRLTSADHTPKVQVFAREFPSSTAWGDMLRRLADRKVAVLCVYTGGLDALYNHPDQLFHLYADLRGRIKVMYFPEANHTFTERREQQQLIESVLGWLTGGDLATGPAR